MTSAHAFARLEQCGPDRVRVYCTCGWPSGKRVHVDAAALALRGHVRARAKEARMATEVLRPRDFLLDPERRLMTAEERGVLALLEGFATFTRLCAERYADPCAVLEMGVPEMFLGVRAMMAYAPDSLQRGAIDAAYADMMREWRVDPDTFLSADDAESAARERPTLTIRFQGPGPQQGPANHAGTLLDEDGLMLWSHYSSSRPLLEVDLLKNFGHAHQLAALYPDGFDVRWEEQ